MRVRIDGVDEDVDVARAEQLVIAAGGELGPAIVLLARAWGEVAAEASRRAMVATCPCDRCGS